MDPHGMASPLLKSRMNLVRSMINTQIKEIDHFGLIRKQSFLAEKVSPPIPIMYIVGLQIFRSSFSATK